MESICEVLYVTQPVNYGNGNLQVVNEGLDIHSKMNIGHCT